MGAQNSLVPLAERRFLLVKFRLLPKERSPSQSSGHPCHHLSLWGFDGLILREILWTNSRYRMKPATKSPTVMLAKTKERQNHRAIQFHHSRWNEVASMKLILVTGDPYCLNPLDPKLFQVYSWPWINLLFLPVPVPVLDRRQGGAQQAAAQAHCLAISGYTLKRPLNQWFLSQFIDQ